MADTYEKDLGQKTSLTVSDYIRVVGSDNVSYKQLVSNVMGTMGVIRKDLTTSITAYADTLVVGCMQLIRIATNDVATVDVPSGYQYSGGIIYRETSTESVIVLYRANADGVAIRRKYNGAWASWVIQPTRAEVDALNSNSWSSASTVSGLSSGIVKYTRIGKIVLVDIQDLTLSSIPTGTGTAIATGLPEAAVDVIGIIKAYNSTSTLRVLITGTKLAAHYISSTFAATGSQHYGFLIYVAK